MFYKLESGIYLYINYGFQLVQIITFVHGDLMILKIKPK